MTPEQLAELRAWARRLQADGTTAELRAAARAILMLTGEVERLRAALDRPDDDLPPPPPPSSARGLGLADRLRLGSPRARDAEPPEDDTSVLRAQVASAASAVRRAASPRRLRVAVMLAALGALVVAAYAGAARLASPDLDAHGPADDRVGRAELSRLTFWASADAGTLADVRWRVDGRDVTARMVRAGDRVVLDARELRDGEHVVSVEAPGPFLGADTERTWRFVVDTRPPAVRIPTLGVPKGRPVVLRGRVEQGAVLTVDGEELDVDGGRFTVRYPELPRRALRLVARDEAGNVLRRSLRLELVPRRPPVAVRAVHVTAFAWATPSLRRTVLDLLDEGRINAVELDLKDEAGIVGFDADVPLGRRIGAVRDVYDLEDAVRRLHARGAWVIGRLVAFRDPIHARAAWRAGRRAEVVQTPGGGPYAGYGGFTNFASPAVRRYNIEIARAAAEAGVDDILYDYIRRPDGPIESMVFPGLRGTPEASIAGFLRETAQALEPYDVFLGASVFGVAATRPLEVAQDIPAMAREVDYVAPMLYPSHWAPGEYDVASPNAEPYAIVRRSLVDFTRQTKGTGARVVPWLQDFSLGVTYGPAEVRAQIRAARDAGIGEFLLWDPLVTYTADALDRTARRAPAAPARTTPPPPRTTVRANELGEVPVIMYHQIRADGGGDYDLTPAEFRGELERLYRLGYRPVRAVDLATGRIDVPAGKSPVVLTFDDSTKEQLARDPRGRVRGDTAVGIMLEFARRHPDFRPAGTFFVNREPFGGVAEGSELLRFLVRNGFELGNHTDDHVPFDRKDEAGVQRALVLGKRLITRAVPDAEVRTMALPLGVQPDPPQLAQRGSWGGETYRHDGVFLVGAEPAASPYSRSWRAGAIPRIRTGVWRGGEPDYASGFWLEELRRNPERRYVSDGDPARITFPRSLAPQLAPRYRARANPY